MVRQCSRPGCSAQAVASFNFDGLERVVWLGPLASARALSAGDLCRRHADRLRPPLHWELRDARSASATNASTAPLAPSRHVAPVSPPPERLPFAPKQVRPAAAVQVVAARADAPGPSSRPRPANAPATTPMLARAFRAAG
jgi:hypothetical protein